MCLSQHILCLLLWLWGVHLLTSNTNETHQVQIILSLKKMATRQMRCYYAWHVIGTGMRACIVYTAFDRSRIFHIIAFFREIRLKILSLKIISIFFSECISKIHKWKIGIVESFTNSWICFCCPVHNPFIASSCCEYWMLKFHSCFPFGDAPLPTRNFFPYTITNPLPQSQ